MKFPPTKPSDAILERRFLEQLVREEGLFLLGVVDLNCKRDYRRYTEWLSEGKHAGMNYLEQNLRCRSDPRHLLEDARVAIVLALPYYSGDTPPSGKEPPRVAQYARLEDYHKLLKKKGKKIIESLLGKSKEAHSYRVVVDSAPLIERAMAAKTDRGFIGKNTLYIHPERGSFLLLAEILTSLPLPVDDKVPVPTHRKTKVGGCGTCTQCQIHCPTGALAKDYSLDANLCLAYWTIEHRGPIPERFWPWLGTYYFGCDICQLVCPYNKKGSPVLVMSERVRELPSLFETATMDQAKYEKYFGGTAMTRAKRNGLRRNALIAMTVTHDPKLPEAIKRAREDTSYPIAETLQQIERYVSTTLSAVRLFHASFPS